MLWSCVLNVRIKKEREKKLLLIYLGNSIPATNEMTYRDLACLLQCQVND